MSDFAEWQSRHLAGGQPPAPFKMEDRVIVEAPAVDGGFSVHGSGVVSSVDYVTDPEDPYGPWAVSVIFDGEDVPMLFNSSELRLEHAHPEDHEVYSGQGEVPAGGFAGLVKRIDASLTPFLAKVAEERRLAAQFADDVETWLRAKTEGGAR